MAIEATPYYADPWAAPVLSPDALRPLPPEVYPDPADYPSEDGKPVDGILVERQCKLLSDPLYDVWQPPGQRTFLALANIGWYYARREPALVPDFLLSMDITARDPHGSWGNSYFQWDFGKAPEVVIEIVSDRRGGEDTLKMSQYCNLGVSYYIVFDPYGELDGGVLRAFERHAGMFGLMDGLWFPALRLGLCLWEGEFQGVNTTWLRWCDRRGRVLPTSAERAGTEARRADTETARVERLMAQLRALGAQPDLD